MLLLVVRACRLWPARELRTAESARRGGSGGVRLERRAPADRGRCATPPVAVIEAAWPVLPSRVVPDLPKKSERTPDMWTARNRREMRQKPPRFTPRDSQFPRDMAPDD